MGTPVGPKFILYSYMDPLRSFSIPATSALEMCSIIERTAAVDAMIYISHTVKVWVIRRRLSSG